MKQAVDLFTKRYGKVMTTFVFLGCGIWLIGMIILPQILMIQKSLRYVDPAASAAVSQIKTSTDQLFVELGRAERAIARLNRERQDASDGDPGTPQGGVFNPFVTQQTNEETAQKTPEDFDVEISALQARVLEINEEIADNDSRLTTAEEAAEPRFSFANYGELFTNSSNRPIFFKTIWSSIMVTLVALVVCYPVAFYLAKVAAQDMTALLMLGLVVPYWVNEILRTFAWLLLLSGDGLINQTLMWLNIVDSPVDWRVGNTAVLIGMVYAYILFMVFPIYNTIETLDSNQIEAAKDLGAKPWQIHRDVVIPHAKPGIAVGCIMTFMLAAGSYAVPVMLGSTTSKWFTEIIYDQFYEGGNWGLGSAYAFVLLITCIIFIMAMMRLFRVNLQDIAR